MLMTRVGGDKDEEGTYHIPSLCILLNVHHSLLLLLLKLRSFPLEFPLSLLEGTLMLPEPFGRGH